MADLPARQLQTANELMNYAGEQFGRLDRRMDDLQTDLTEIQGRLGRVERAISDLSTQNAEHSIRMGRIGDSVRQMAERLVGKPDYVHPCTR